ncbi:MAG: hypothetical protein GYA14_10985 [Ignavibacteria bacterium]|nr:hypothetical protein [Ignavibacteria bacterium]
MKKLITLIIILFLVTSAHLEAKPRIGSFSIGMFYSSLSPYGEWIELDAGLIVWRPNSVHAYWRPYSIGRWSWTKYGWYWDSFEPFGWATYHYGRWFYDDYYGWIWIPDNTWGPAWVEWRYDDDYIGWAPLPPYAQFRIGFGIYFSINWSSHYSYWNFVTYRHFHSHRLHYYLLDQSRNYKIFSRTKYRNNYYSDRDRIINGGIDRSYIERRSGYRIAERDLAETNDFEKYNRSRKSIDEKVYSYRPGDREIENSRETMNMEIKRADRRSSLDTERIVINERTSSDREIRTDRSNDRTSTDIEIRSDRNNDRAVERNDRPRENENISRRDVVRDNNERNYSKEERKITPRNDEPKIERRNTEERRNNNTDIFQRREEVKRNPESSNRREINRESESRNSRNESPSRTVERSSDRSRETSERKSATGESDRRR